MDATAKDRYAAFCLSAQVPAYNQAWWLDAICGPQNWGVALAADKRGELAAALPYFQHTAKGLPTLLTPPLTPYMGPWFYPAFEQADTAKQFTLGRQLVPALLEQLPKHRLHFQKLQPGVRNWMPFQWAGFRQNLRYHFVLPELGDGQQLYRQFNRSVKYSITHAKDTLSVEASEDAGLLFGLMSHTFDRQGLSLPVSRALLQRMMQAVGQQGNGELLLARHKDGNCHSALFLLHSQGTTYTIAGGNGPGSRDSGAFAYLAWESMLRSAAHSHTFNFCGSTMPNIAAWLNGFRAQLLPYFELYRAQPTWASPLLQYWL